MANLATINNNILADSGIDPLSLIVGTGTVNYVPKFTAEDTVANSQIFDNGTNVGIGTATPSVKLHVINTAGVAAYFTSSNNSVPVSLFNNGSALATIGFKGTTTSSEFNVRVGADANDFVAYTNNTEQMRITSGGALLVGTTSNPYSLGALVVNHNSSLTRTYFQRGVDLIEIVPSDGTQPNQISSSYTISGSGYKPLSISARQNQADLYLTTGGLVGIGTTSPGSKLQVNSVAGNYGIVNTNGTVSVGTYIEASNSYASFGTSSNHPLGFFTNNNAPQMYITTAGNVGIGTTSPGTRLVVQQSADNAIGFSVTNPTGRASVFGYSSTFQLDIGSSTNDNIRYGNFGAGSGVLSFLNNGSEAMRITSGGDLLVGTTSGTSRIQAVGKANEWVTDLQASTTPGQSYGLVIRAGTSSGDFPFYVLSADNSTAFMAIKGNGNVGIGTTSPSTKLHISNAANGNIALFTNTNDADLFINLSSGVTSLSPSTGILAFGTSSTERMRLDASGNLGLGTSSPAAKLHVAAAAVSGTIDRAVIIANSSASGSGSGSEIYLGWNSPSINAGAGVTIGASYAGGGTNMLFSTPSSIPSAPNVKMTLDGNGNLGLGVTPSAWTSTWRAIQLPGGSIYSNAGGTTGQIAIGQNWYYDGTQNRYINSAAASDYYQYAGEHRWFNAPSGTAGNAISFTQAMTLNASGQLLIGTTSAQSGTRLQVAGFLDVWSSANTLLRLNHDGTRGIIETFTGGGYAPTSINPNGGNVLIGTTTDAGYKLDVSGTARITSNLLAQKVQVGTAATINDAAGVANTLQFANYTLGTFITGSADNYIYKTSNVIGTLSAQTLIFQTRSDVAGGGFAFVSGATPSVIANISSNGAVRFNVYGSGSFTGTRAYDLSVDASGNIIEVPVGAGTITGSGTTNYIPKFTSSSAIGNSIVQDYGDNVWVGTNTAGYGTLNIQRFTSAPYATLTLTDQATPSNPIGLYLRSNGSSPVGISSAGAPIAFYTGGPATNEGMRLDASGNLLIGLSSALANGKLQVAGSIGLSGNTQIRQATNSDGNTLQVFATQVIAGNLNSYSYGYSGGGLLASVSAGDSILLFDAGRTTSTEGRVKIANTTLGNVSFSVEKNGVTTLFASTLGNVGIGSANPQVKLDVQSGSIGAYHNTASSGGAQLYLGDMNFAGGAYATSAPGVGAVYGPTHLVAGDLAFYVYNGVASSRSEAMRIIRHSSGNNYVGIGTTTPTTKLHVLSSDNTYANLVIAATSNNGNVTGGLTFGGLYNSDALNFYTGASSITKMYISNAGNVGIGTTSPTYKLHINTSNNNDGIAIYYPATSLQFPFYVGDNSNGVYAQLSAYEFEFKRNGGASTIKTVGSNNNLILQSANNLVFNTNGATERMRITSGGNVLIGTTTDVSGVGKFVINYASSDNYGIILNNTYTATSNNGYFQRFYNNGTEIGTFYAGNAAGSLFSIVGKDGLSFATNGAPIGTERMRIATTGAVRFNAYGSGSFTGTVAYNLAVDASGNIIETAGGVVDGSGTTNYVPKWSDPNTLTNSMITDDGTTVTVNGVSTVYFKVKASTNSGIDLLQDTAGTGYLWNRDNAAIQFGTNNTERMRLDASGNLGLGTSSPLSDASTKIFTIYDASQPRIQLLNSTSGTSLTDGVSLATVGLDFYINNRENGNVLFFNNGAERMRLDASGNLGLGVTPSAWASGYKAFEFGNSSAAVSALFSNGANDFWSVSNAYFDGTSFKYITTGTATGYEQVNGSHKWYQVASGSGGTNISFTQAMTLDASGRLGIGKTSIAHPLDVNGIARFDAAAGAGRNTSFISRYSNDNNYTLTLSQVVSASLVQYSFDTKNNGTTYLNNLVLDRGNVGIGTTSPTRTLSVHSSSGPNFELVRTGFGGYTYIEDDGSNSIYRSSGATIFQTGGTSERMRITSGGELLINTTSDAGDYKLQVNGKGYFVNNQTDLVLNATSNTQYSRLVFQDNAVESGVLQYINNNFTTTYRRNKLEIANGNGIHFVSSGDFSNADLVLNSSGNAEFKGSIKTAAPSGGTAATWKLGSRISNTCGLPATYADFSSQFMNTNKVIEVEIGGVTVYIPTVTPGWC
jgi:hypothetical protein